MWDPRLIVFDRTFGSIVTVTVWNPRGGDDKKLCAKEKGQISHPREENQRNSNTSRGFET